MPRRNRPTAFRPNSATIVVGAPRALATLEELLVWADEIHFAFAWASSSRGLAKHWRALRLDRVKRGVVGVHFAQTEPHALRVMATAADRIRVHTEASGVFHPKTIVAVKGHRVRALVGSSNFTEGGFATNAEVNVAIDLPDTAPEVQELLGAIERWWKAGAPITKGWLARYEKLHAARPRPTTSRTLGAGVGEPLGWSLLDVPWRAYHDMIVERDGAEASDGGSELLIFDDDQGGALHELDLIRHPFADAASFRETTIEERRRAGGYGKDVSGWFGALRANRTFQGLLRDQHRSGARWLDAVPHEGPADDARKPAERFMRAMLARPRIGIAAASRLLLAKRPDLFLVPNAANAAEWTRFFGPQPTTAEEYLEFHERLWTLPWHRSREPRRRNERRLWRGRAAMLDTLLYDAFPRVTL